MRCEGLRKVHGGRVGKLLGWRRGGGGCPKHQQVRSEGAITTIINPATSLSSAKKNEIM